MFNRRNIVTSTEFMLNLARVLENLAEDELRVITDEQRAILTEFANKINSHEFSLLDGLEATLLCTKIEEQMLFYTRKASRIVFRPRLMLLLSMLHFFNNASSRVANLYLGESLSLCFCDKYAHKLRADLFFTDGDFPAALKKYIDFLSLSKAECGDSVLARICIVLSMLDSNEIQTCVWSSNVFLRLTAGAKPVSIALQSFLAERHSPECDDQKSLLKLKTFLLAMAKRLDPTIKIDIEQIGSFHYEQRNYCEAIRVFSHILERDLFNSDLWSKRGDAHYGLAMSVSCFEIESTLEAAERDYHHAIMLNANNAQAYIGLGKILYVRHQLREAIRQFDLASASQADNIEALEWRAKTFLLLGELEAAEESLNRLDPRSFVTCGLMSRLESLRGEQIPALVRLSDFVRGRSDSFITDRDFRTEMAKHIFFVQDYGVLDDYLSEIRRFKCDELLRYDEQTFDLTLRALCNDSNSAQAFDLLSKQAEIFLDESKYSRSHPFVRRVNFLAEYCEDEEVLQQAVTDAIRFDEPLRLRCDILSFMLPIMVGLRAQGYIAEAPEKTAADYVATVLHVLPSPVTITRALAMRNIVFATRDFANVPEESEEMSELCSMLEEATGEVYLCEQDFGVEQRLRFIIEFMWLLSGFPEGGFCPRFFGLDATYVITDLIVPDTAPKHYLN